MKNKARCLLALLISAVCAAANAEWTFTVTNTTPTGLVQGSLTNGVWSLHATLANDNELKVSGLHGSFKAECGSSPIDLTTIKDADGKQYFAVQFSYFSSYTQSANYPLRNYREFLTEFIAPHCKSITESGSFYGCLNMTNVVLSDTGVSFSHGRQFQDCKSLAKFHPRTIASTSIQISMFSGCQSLAGEFNFPNVTVTDSGIFAGCSKIQSILLPMVKNITSTSFKDCSALTNVVFSDELTGIESEAFSGCESLSGDYIRKIFNKGLTKIGTKANTSKAFFSRCISLYGAIEWNFPNLDTSVCSNVIWASFFEGCTNLTKVTVVSDVLEIRGGAFKNLAPGAEVYLPAKVPVITSGEAIGNSKGPFIQVYLEDNYEDWLNEFSKMYHVMLKEDFNNKEWTTGDIYARTRDNLVSRMKEDYLMCEYNEDSKDVKVLKNRVLAFAMQKKTGVNFSSYTCCWILKDPKQGLSVIVR